MKFRNKLLAKSRQYNLAIFSKWLVDEELVKNSSLHFELISTILESMHCEISMKMLIKVGFFHFAIFLIGALGL